MSQIGFTHKTEEIYNRFQDMRREYESKHGRTYAPDFLAVLMDVMKYIHQLNTARVKWISHHPKTADRFVLEVTEDGIQLYQVHPDREGDEWVEINKIEPISLRAYIADAEANDPQLKTGWAGTEPDEFLREHGYRTELEKPDANRVVIRSTVASGMYLEKAYSFDNLFDLTNHKECAMSFDNEEQAKAFLRKCGRVVEEWILEPENE